MNPTCGLGRHHVLHRDGAQLTPIRVPQLLAEHSSNFKSGIDPDYGVVSALLAAFSFRPFQISSPRYMLLYHHIIVHSFTAILC